MPGVRNFRATLKGLRDMMFAVHVMARDSDAGSSHLQAHVAVSDLAKGENLTRECSGRGIAQFPNSIGYASGLVEGLDFRSYMGPGRCTDYIRIRILDLYYVYHLKHLVAIYRKRAC